MDSTEPEAFLRLPEIRNPTLLYRVFSKSLCEAWGRYNSAFTGIVSIASCFTVKNLLSVYDRAEFTYVPIERKTEGEFVDGTYSAGT